MSLSRLIEQSWTVPCNNRIGGVVRTPSTEQSTTADTGPTDGIPTDRTVRHADSHIAAVHGAMSTLHHTDGHN